MDFYEKLFAIMAQDAGGRGFHGPRPDLAALTADLLRADRALLLTGFPVARSDTGEMVGETDGPVGSAELAAALEALGRTVTVATDAPSRPMVSAALATAGVRASVALLPLRDTATHAAALLQKTRPQILIALERPGKGADGHFHNMRGRVIDGSVADTDCLLSLAREAGAVTVGVGDGGNELGMGALRALAPRPGGCDIAAALPADYALTAGVSNWWGPGLAALLSYGTGRWLLPSRERETAILQAVVDAGGVEGRQGLPALSVDGLPLEVHLKRLDALAALLREAGVPEP